MRKVLALPLVFCFGICLISTSVRGQEKNLENGKVKGGTEIDVLIRGVSAGAPANVHGDNAEFTKEMERFQGTWVVTSFTMAGGATPDPKILGDTFTIDGNKFTLAPKTELMKGTVKVDPTQKPKAMDLDVTEGRKKGVILCIYALDADELTLSFGQPGVKERPTDLGGKKGTNHTVVTLKRKTKSSANFGAEIRSVHGSGLD